MQEAQPPKKSGMNVIVILVILFLLCVCCSIACFAGLTLAFKATSTAVKESVNETICAGPNSDIDIEKVYENATTENFKDNTTLSEFNSLVDELEKEVCSDLKNLDIITLIKNQWNVSYNNENGEEVLNITGKVNNKSIVINMVTEGEDLKIDKITIE